MVKKDKVRLGDVCTIVSGTTPKTGTKEYWDGELNWITPAELSDDIDIIYKTERKITNKAVTDSSLKLLPVGTVLLSSRAPIGKVAIVGSPMYCNQGFKNLICSNSIFNKFLYWFLKGKKDFLNSLGRGATFKEISKSIVADIQIPLPPLSEQKKIAAILDKATELIALRKQQIEKLDLLVKSRFIEMFGDPIQNAMTWPQMPAQEVCTKITDGEHNSVPRTQKGFVFLNAKHIKKNGDIDRASSTYIGEKDHLRIYSRCNPEQNDILLTTTGTIGNVAIVSTALPFSMDRGITLLKLNKELLNHHFMAYLLRFESMQKIMSQSVRTATIGHLFLKQVMTLPIITPPLFLQEEFAAFVQQVDKSKSTLQQSLEKLELNYKALMQTYFG